MLLLFVGLGLGFEFQRNLSDGPLVATYLFNALLTVLGMFLLWRLQKKRPEILGFVFMGLSGLKFTLFFICFKPFALPLEEKRLLFWDFFIPYAICMVLEVLFLVKSLNQKS